MIVSVPSSARGEEPVTGASSMLRATLGQRGADRACRAGPIVDMSTHSSPGRAASMAAAGRAASATWSPSTTMLITMSLARGDLGRRARRRSAPCSAAQRSALPGVCVQTVSG